MSTWQPDPSFYPSPRLASKAPPERLAYVAAFDPERKAPDSIAVVEVDPQSASYSRIVGTVAGTYAGDEFHHFGWNACSSCLCPNAPHPHVERRYLVVPGLRSSRIYILDTKPDPRAPKIVKVIEPQEIAEKTGYTRPHTVHCGPGGIYVAAMLAAIGTISIVVYKWIGVAFLRRGWINLDLLWTTALVVCGIVLLVI